MGELLPPDMAMIRIRTAALVAAATAVIPSVAKMLAAVVAVVAVVAEANLQRLR